MPEPHDRVALLTGAAGHLGRACAAAFAAAGWRLALLGRDEAGLRRVFGPPDERTLLLACDLLDASSVQRAVDTVSQGFGRLDALANLAGGFTMGDAVHEAPDAVWQRMHDLNVVTLLNACRAVVPVMLGQGQGAIVNVGAASARTGGGRAGPYAAAKSSVMRLTESMAAELRDRGVRVNAVLPSILDTPENRADMPGADPSAWVAPDALADVIVFLASDGARAMHGALVPVTGRV